VGWVLEEEEGGGEVLLVPGELRRDPLLLAL